MRPSARAQAAMHARGLTAAQDAWLTPDELAFWGRVDAAGELRLRFRGALIMEPGQTLAEWRDRLDEYERAAFGLRGGDRLDAGILKGFADGVIEARTASMLEPYEDDTGRGLPAWEPDAARCVRRRGGPARLAGGAARHRGPGRAPGPGRVRARGARQRAWAGDPRGTGATPGTHARRHRVEHIETIHPADIGRFAALGVVASMQPYHGDPSPNQIDVWAGNIGPERASRAWAWTSIRTGGRSPRIRIRLAGRPVRPVHRAQQCGEPPDRRR